MMTEQSRTKRGLFLAAAGLASGLMLALPGDGLAASMGGSGSGASDASGGLSEAEAKIAAQDYDDAIPLLKKILQDYPKNADALNYLGYSYRKIGDYDTALDYYLRALAVEPTHVGANEYLGELYLETGDLAKAEERLLALTKACSGCEEQMDLEKQIQAYKSKTQS